MNAVESESADTNVSVRVFTNNINLAVGLWYNMQYKDVTLDGNGGNIPTVFILLPKAALNEPL